MRMDLAPTEAVPEASLADPGRVIATVYEIGGPLTGVLSGSVAKQLPLIPHIGIRCHGTEYFYSDHIEYRTVPVMEEMLGDRPQVSIDLGPAAQSEEEVRATLAELDAEWEAKDYHVFDKNCVHFAGVLADRVCKKDDAIEPKLLQGQRRPPHRESVARVGTTCKQCFDRSEE